MQLHPAEPGDAIGYAAESLAAGFIGLDFRTDVGDLLEASQGDLPDGQKDYWEFAHEMAVGDQILVIVHHYPFALAKVVGEYNYIRRAEPEIGVWFRHFRRIDRQLLRFYADRLTNPKAWDRITMTDTISPLRDPSTQSFQLIKAWLKDTGSP